MQGSLDVLIVNYNASHHLDEMFSKLRNAAKGLDVHYYIVDNASVDDSLHHINSNYSDVILVENTSNVGFGRANNQLLKFVKNDYVLLLNTDAFVAPDTLRKTIDFMDSQPECGVLGVRLVGRDGKQQPSCRFFPDPLNVFLSRIGLERFFPWKKKADDMDWAHDEVRECDWVPGCFYVVRREIIDQLGLFDPRFFLYYEEVDHCKRVKDAGWKVIYYPGTEVVHLGGESAKSSGELTETGKQLSEFQVESELLYFRKHYGLGGVVAHLVLTILGDSYISIKALVKPRKTIPRPFFAQSKQTWHLFKKTRWGLVPTR